MEAMFYSVVEMSEILGITERSVYRSKDKIPGFVKISGRVYFRKSTFHRATLGIQRPIDEVIEGDDPHNLVN